MYKKILCFYPEEESKTISYVGEGNVVLVSGGGKCFTDVAARFVGSEKSLNEILQLL